MALFLRSRGALMQGLPLLVSLRLSVCVCVCAVSVCLTPTLALLRHDSTSCSLSPCLLPLCLSNPRR